jgi:protein ImuB
MKRILCLWFPDWPIQHLLRSRPELGESFWILFTETLRGRDLVRFACAKSKQAGVKAGMPLSEALAYFPPKRKDYVQPLESLSHQKGLKELAVWCERYSPCVSLEEADPPQSLLLDVTGLEHLFSGEKALAEEILRDITHQGYVAQVGLGETADMARAAARFRDAPASAPARQRRRESASCR